MADLIVKTATDRLKAALREKFEPAVDTRVAARVGNNLVAIRGQFVPGSIDAAAAAVVNTGRPSAAQYSAANGGTVVISGSGSSGGGGSTGGGVTSFSGLTGIIGDTQAPQFLKIDGSRALIGNLAVGAGITIDGVDLSVHAANPDAHHNKLHGIVDATVHTVTGNPYDVIGLSATNTLAVLPTTADGRTNPSTILRAGAAGDLQLTTLSTDFVTALGNLKLDPVGGVIFDVTQTLNSIGFNGDTFPIGGWSIYQTAIAGQSGLTIGYIKADELHVKVFVADETRVDRGEVYISKSYGIINADLTTPAAIGGTVKVYFEDSAALAGAIFSNNDWLVIRVVDRSGGGLNVSSIWFQATSYADESATFPLDPNQQSWTLTLRQGTTSYLIKKGNIAIDYGASGQGIIQETVIDASGSPYIKLFTWAGANPYTPANYTTHAKLGKLINADDPTGRMLPTGWGLYSDNVFLNGNLVSGGGLIQLTMNDGLNFQQDVGTGSPNTVLAIQWWPDITNQTGDPTLSMLTWKNTTVGPFLGVNTSEIAARATGGVSAYFQLLSIGVTGTGRSAKLSLDSGAATSGTSIAFLNADKINLGDSSASVYTTGSFITRNISVDPSGAFDIGTIGNPFSSLYVNTIVASTITGGTALSGQVWEYDSGDMYIESNNALNRVLHVANTSTGIMSLDVEGDIVLGGLVDGVDVATLSSGYTTHAASANAHHNQSHVFATVTALGADHTVTGLTAGMVLKATGSITAKFIALDHSELTGLTTGDPHTQYVSVATARTITAIHTFSPATATAPFILSTNARGQTVTGFKADQLNRTVTAGVGLSGGGLLTADIALALGTPSTGTVSTINSVTGTTHSHAVTSSSNPGVAAALLASTSAGGLTLQTLALAGSGAVLTSTSGTISMADATDTVHKLGMLWLGYMTGSAGQAAVAHRDFLAANTYALKQTSIGIGGSTYVNAPSGQMVYYRINDADVMQMGNARLNPAGSGLISLGDYNRKWSELFVSQLIVDNLVASNVMATIGGRIMVAPTAKLTRDITNSATTIYLDSNLNIAPQELYMAGYKAGGVPQTEHMRIMSGPVSLGGGEYSYVVQRNIKATGNMYASNIGFEVNTSTWVFLYSASLGPALTRDTSIYNYGIASGRVNLPTGTGFSGVLSEYVTVTAGQLYTVSFWAKTTSVASLRFDSSTVTLALNGITVSGTTGWVRYTYNFTCATTEGVTFRAYDTNPTGGIFWLDEVIMEPKFAATGSAWYIDDANVNLGYKAGSGYIDLTSLTTIQGHYGPTVAVYAHTKDGGQPKPTAALGNLRSYVDYTADTMGWGVGNDLTLSPTGGFQGMTGDAVSGLRLFNVVQKMYSAGVEFLRLDTTTGLGLMSYLGTPSSYGTSPSINGLTFFRDSIGGNRSGQFSSAYNSGAGLGNDTFLVSYDSTVGAARTTIGVLDSVYAVSMGLYLRAYKASTSQFGYAQLGGNGGSVEVITAWANLGLGSAGMYFGDNSAGAGSGVPIINVSTGAFQNLNYGIVFHYSALQTGPSASRSEITNDVGTFKALMLLGNTAAGGLRRVSIFDQLSINQASYNLQLNVNGGVFLANITAPGTPSGGGYLYTNAGKLMYKGSSGTVTTVGLA